MSPLRLRLIPAGEARELPEDEAWRELFDTFHVLADEPTRPMPLELEPLPDETFRARVRRVLGSAT